MESKNLHFRALAWLIPALLVLTVSLELQAEGFPITPTTEAIFSIRQYCDDASGRMNVITPVRKYDLSSDGLTYTWAGYSLESEGFDLEHPIPLSADNVPLNVTGLPDCRIRVKVTDIESGEFQNLIFTVFGSKQVYTNNNSLGNDGLIDTTYWSGLVVFKQFYLENELNNRRLWYQSQEGDVLPNHAYRAGNFRSRMLILNANTHVVVLTGFKAFNRLSFDNGGGITIGEGCLFTSSCNQWGGIFIGNRAKCLAIGNSSNPITIEKANIGIFVAHDYAQWAIDDPNEALVNDEFPFSYTALLQFVVPFIRLEFVNFKSNYFHIYQNLQIDSLSYVFNCNFDCNPDEMLPPYSPVVDTVSGEIHKTMTEACIVGYSTKLGIGFLGSNFYTNIKDCTFNNALFGVLIPYEYSMVLANTYNNIGLAGIRRFVFPGQNQPTGFAGRFANQTITLFGDRDDWCSYRHQVDSLGNYWNKINGYLGKLRVVDLPTGSTTDANPSISRWGLSTGWESHVGSVLSTSAYGILHKPYDDFYPSFDSVGVEFVSNVIYATDVESKCNNNSPLLTGKNSTGILSEEVNIVSSCSFNDLTYSLQINQNPNQTITANDFNMPKVIGIVYSNPANYTQTNYITLRCNRFNSGGDATGIKILDGCATVWFGLPNASSGNVWPVAAGTDRSYLLNGENPDDEWSSPPGWISIHKPSSLPLQYYKYSNEFVGNYVSSSQFDINISTSIAYNSYNNFPNGVPNNAVQVCIGTVVDQNVYFPTSAKPAPNDHPTKLGAGTGSITRENLEALVKSPQSTQVFDLLGRRLTTLPERGVVIVVTKSDNQVITNRYFVR